MRRLAGARLLLTVFSLMLVSVPTSSADAVQAQQITPAGLLDIEGGGMIDVRGDLAVIGRMSRRHGKFCTEPCRRSPSWSASGNPPLGLGNQREAWERGASLRFGAVGPKAESGAETGSGARAGGVRSPVLAILRCGSPDPSASSTDFRSAAERSSISGKAK